MFGYVKPHLPELKVKQNDLYKAIYCGLCKRQKKLTGYLSSINLSYDFVFLAMLRTELTDGSFSVEKGRCHYNPIKKVNYIGGCDGMDYTALCASVLTYYKIKDNIQDSKGLKKLPYYFLLPFASYARKKALKHDIPDTEVKALLEELSVLEKENKGADKLSEKFGELLSVIASYGVSDGMQHFALERIFFAIGKWVYLIDAADDLCDDIKNKEFNPFKPDGIKALEMLPSVLQNTLCDIDPIVTKINYKNYDIGEIIKNTVLLGTKATEDKVILSSMEKLYKLQEKSKGKDKNE